MWVCVCVHLYSDAEWRMPNKLDRRSIGRNQSEKRSRRMNQLDQFSGGLHAPTDGMCSGIAVNYLIWIPYIIVGLYDSVDNTLAWSTSALNCVGIVSNVNSVSPHPTGTNFLNLTHSMRFRANCPTLCVAHIGAEHAKQTSGQKANREKPPTWTMIKHHYEFWNVQYVEMSRQCRNARKVCYVHIWLDYAALIIPFSGHCCAIPFRYKCAQEYIIKLCVPAPKKGVKTAPSQDERSHD